MPIEILTVGLDDDTIDKLAARVAIRLADEIADSNGRIRTANPPAQNTHRTQTDQVSESDGSGWSNEAAPAQDEYRQPEPEVPTCTHGPMKYVPGGYSKRTNKPYDAFYACQGPRDSQCKGVKA